MMDNEENEYKKELAQRFVQFANDFSSGYLYDPDGKQLSSDLRMPTKDLIDEFRKISAKTEYMTKDEYLNFNSRVYQYMGYLMNALQDMEEKTKKAANRITEEIVEDLIRGDFGV